MSSCAASCFICCHRVSCASVTSDSSPTVTALRSCRCVCDCSEEHRKTQPRRHQRPPIRILSGTARSAAQPCPSSNGSPLRNSCFARHLNQTGVQHEALSTSPALVRASARSRILGLFRSKPLRYQPLHPLHQVSASQYAAPSSPSVIRCCPTLFVPDPSAPVQTHSKYIGFHVGGFLQVAVSEAPPKGIQLRTVICRALQIQH
jgi:hypothetical protein